MSGNPKRVVLTAKQIRDADAQLLVSVLDKILDDGVIESAEVQELASALEGIDIESRIPAVTFLREICRDILADGVVEANELKELFNAILRVLPPEHRARAKDLKKARENQERQERLRINSLATERQIEYIKSLGGPVHEGMTKEEASALIREWNRDLATERQIQFIEDLGGCVYEGMSKQEASDLIQELLDSTPTVRQRMVLRFWNRLDLNYSGVEEVTDWMDEWYDADPRRKEAWEMWKLENNDIGQRDPSLIETVPIGAGYNYLNRLPVSNPRKSSGCLGVVLLCLVVSAGLLIFAAVV